MNYMDKYAMIISKICHQTTPGKKTLQKLMYLMERKGVALNLNYSIHFYGPYSSRLDDALHALFANDMIDIQTEGNAQVISVQNMEEIDFSIEDEEQEKIQFVLDRFLKRQPRDLEILTTLDFVATKMLKNQGDDAQIIQTVQRMKKNQFSEEEMKRGLQLLKDYEFLSR